jgi:undecaprenyl-diphosphatase
MTVPQAVISGAVQGLTEFLPISSSGHLVLLHKMFGFKEAQLAFDIFLHLATVLSVLVFFAKDILDILVRDRKMMALIILACVPTFAIGLLFKHPVERLFADPTAVGYMLIVTGIWLVSAHMIYKRVRAPREVTPKSSILIGIAQGIAVVPGISRSGATIGMAMALGIEGQRAVKFSFLLSVPAVLGASAVKCMDIKSGLMASGSPVFIAGGIAAFFAGLAAIYLLLKMVKANKLWAFGAYCIVVGAATLYILR